MTTKESFIESIMEQHNKTRADAEKLYNIYIDNNIILIHKSAGGYTLAQGVFWEPETIDHILGLNS